MDGEGYADLVPVGLFSRLSTGKRTEELTEHGFERQHERSAGHCLARGWNPVRFYRDLGSAYRKVGQVDPPWRKDFERSLSDIEAGAIKGIVFFKLDRFVRDHKDFDRALAVCEKHGAFLSSVTEPIDTTTPMGEAIARLLVQFARMESQTIALRVAAQAEQRARLGKPWRGGRHRPYGYEPEGEDEVRIVENEAEVIRDIAKRLITGQSVGEVVTWLNEAGIPSPAGVQWTRGNLPKLLKHPRLAGKRTYHGEVVAEGTWEPILDEETFERVSLLFAQRARAGRPPTRWLLSGIVHCGAENCGVRMEMRGHKGKMRYQCLKPSQHGLRQGGCGSVAIMAEPLEKLVEEMVIKRLAGPKLAKLKAKLVSAEHRAIAEQRQRDEDALVDAARRRFVLRDSNGEPLLKERAYAQVSAELEQRIAGADRILKQDEAVGVLMNLPRLESELRAYWAKAGIEHRREITRAILPRLVIKPTARRGPGLDESRIDPRWRN